MGGLVKGDRETQNAEDASHRNRLTAHQQNMAPSWAAPGRP